MSLVLLLAKKQSCKHVLRACYRLKYGYITLTLPLQISLCKGEIQG